MNWLYHAVVRELGLLSDPHVAVAVWQVGIWAAPQMRFHLRAECSQLLDAFHMPDCYDSLRHVQPSALCCGWFAVHTLTVLSSFRPSRVYLRGRLTGLDHCMGVVVGLGGCWVYHIWHVRSNKFHPFLMLTYFCFFTPGVHTENTLQQYFCINVTVGAQTGQHTELSQIFSAFSLLR